MKKAILMLGVLFLVGCSSVPEGWGFHSMKDASEEEYVPSQIIPDCLEDVKAKCSHLDGNKYNECKWDKFYSECSKGDCLEYWGYNIVIPSQLTLEESKMLVDHGFLEKDILKCYEEEPIEVGLNGTFSIPASGSYYGEPPSIEEIEIEWKDMMYCSWNYYEIRYVDGFVNLDDKCYAFRNTKLQGYERQVLEESFKRINESAYDYFTEKKLRCREIETEGEIWCLRDNSVCLQVEDRICNLINMSK